MIKTLFMDFENLPGQKFRVTSMLVTDETKCVGDKIWMLVTSHETSQELGTNIKYQSHSSLI